MQTIKKLIVSNDGEVLIFNRQRIGEYDEFLEYWQERGEAKVLESVKAKAREIKRNIFVLFLAYKDPRVPWYAKLFAICVVAYAFSPIDLIPDFIPVLGYLDDLIIVPLGIALALKMIPAPVIEQCKVKAEEIRKNGKPKNWITGALFILIWFLLAIWLGSVFYKFVT